MFGGGGTYKQAAVSTEAQPGESGGQARREGRGRPYKRGRRARAERPYNAAVSG